MTKGIYFARYKMVNRKLKWLFSLPVADSTYKKKVSNFFFCHSSIKIVDLVRINHDSDKVFVTKRFSALLQPPLIHYLIAILE